MCIVCVESAIAAIGAAVIAKDQIQHRDLPAKLRRLGKRLVPGNGRVVESEDTLASNPSASACEFDPRRGHQEEAA